MFKIGDFSKLSRVSVRMLRHYDELGLFKPASVDNFTGYRYYAANQMARLNRILALRDLGLSLEQVGQLLRDGLTPEQIRGMLKLKRSELYRQLEEGQAQLARIENWLQQEEVIMPAYAVITKKVETQRMAQARAKAPDMSKLGPTLDRLFDTVLDYARQHNALRPEPNPPTTVYYDEEFREQDIDVGACIGVNNSLVGNQEVEVLDLPGYDTVASTIHHGPFANLSAAYQAISEWIATNHYQICGPARELNLEYERGAEQSKFVTEVQFPVKKA